VKKSGALLFVIIVLAASCLIAAKPAFSSVAVAEDTWVAKAPMQQARAGLGVVAVNGKIYAIGGTHAAGTYPPDVFRGFFLGTNEEYDPETDTWTTKAPMPTPRDYFAIAAYKNKIYCIGGAVGYIVHESHNSFHSYNSSGINEVYDTVTDTWETKAPMPDEGMHIQAHVVNGKIYVIDWSFVFVYDPESDSWTSKTRMPPPYPQFWPVSVVVGNKIIVTGEFSVEYVRVQKVMIYDTETDSWSEGKTGPTVIVKGAAGATTGVYAPQKVYVLGRLGEAPNPTGTNQVYDPETDTWSTATAVPASRSDFGVVVVNDRLYVIGGYIRPSGYGVQPVAVNEQYTPLGYGTVPPVISVVSPEDQTYNATSVSLVFTVNKPAVWLGYSLDGQDNVTVTGNTTITGLSNGLHNVTVYAKDEFENTGVSETVSFSVDVPFPTTPVAVASVATVVVVGAGLLVYFKKRKR
jgi:hypothetical protein